MVGVMNYSVWIGQLFTSELIHILIELKNLTSHFFLRVLMGLTDRRKTVKNLVDSRKNWKILTVSRKWGKKELTVKEIVFEIC